MTSLTLVRRIKAPPSVVFEALTTSEGFTSWMGPDAGPVLLAEISLRIGGRYRVRFRLLDGSEHEATGEYLELVPNEHIVMSWRWAEGGAPEESGNLSRLEFHLRPIDVGTELTLTHARLKNEPSRKSHESGWSGALDKLDRHINAKWAPLEA
jgi:uncharacterized protein YndB with AHSA1/START domain